MLDLHVQNSSHIRSDARARFVHQDKVLPRFEDVLGVFRTLSESAIVVKHLLLLRPVFRRQQENYDRVMRCLAHLIYLLINTVHTEAQNKLICQAVHEAVVVGNLRSASTADTMLHLCASRLNVIKSGYITDDNFADVRRCYQLPFDILIEHPLYSFAEDCVPQCGCHQTAHPVRR